MLHRRSFLVASLMGCASSRTVLADMSHMEHMHDRPQACAEATLACAATATPAFAPDGALWLAARSGNRIFVVKSLDHGGSFSPPMVITPDSATLDWGPDSRPKIVIAQDGRVIVAYATFRDDRFNGEVFHTLSTDGGLTFAPAKPITADAESQRFVTLAIDADGSIFSAWLDKRGRAQANAKDEAYVGAALAFAWSRDGGASFSPAEIVRERTCECCRIGVAFAGEGRPVALFRNIFDGSVRDHAVVTFADRETPGPIYRVSDDDWRTDACPHQGPSLAITPDGGYHAAWFTAGKARRGLFYARSLDGGKSFSEPMRIGDSERAPSRPDLLSAAGKVWLAWKEFDGEETSIMVMVSRDDGAHWGEARRVAATREETDHPILVGDGRRAFLSWQAQKDGYRLIELEDAS